MSFSTLASHFLVIPAAITDTSLDLLDWAKIDDGKKSEKVVGGSQDLLLSIATEFRT